LPQEIARAALIFFYVLILLRIAGPRTFAKFSAIDMITSVIAGSSLSCALTGNSPLFGTLSAIAVFVALHWLFTQGTARWNSLSSMFEGKPAELIADGQLLFAQLRAKGISIAALETAVRGAGLSQIHEVKRATLEPNGQITIWPDG
jgi:uncharacterized membrane protein YcaP (DUF421 family)